MRRIDGATLILVSEADLLRSERGGRVELAAGALLVFVGASLGSGLEALLGMALVPVGLVFFGLGSRAAPPTPTSSDAMGGRELQTMSDVARRLTHYTDADIDAIYQHLTSMAATADDGQ